MDPQLLQSLPVVSLLPGQALIVEGEPLAGLYFLERGAVEIRRAGILINQVEEFGAVLGEMSWLLEKLPTATVTALTPCQLRHAPNSSEFCLAHPAVSLEIARILARRLDSMAQYLVHVKEQFRDQAGHLGILDEVLEAMLSRHPRVIPRRDAGH